MLPTKYPTISTFHGFSTFGALAHFRSGPHLSIPKIYATPFYYTNFLTGVMPDPAASYTGLTTSYKHPTHPTVCQQIKPYHPTHLQYICFDFLFEAFEALTTL
jgi:hypothetical protein